MRESMFLRRKRDIEFKEKHLEYLRRLVLAAEKPKLNTFLAVLNSAAFLWIMTAGCLAVGGSYFTQQQKCLSEGQTLARAFYEIEQELHTRDDAARDAIEDASSVEEVVALYRQYALGNGDYEKLNAVQLYNKRMGILSRVNAAENARYDKHMALDFRVLGALSSLEGAKRYRVSFEQLRELVANTKAIGDSKSPRVQVAANCEPKAIWRQMWDGNTDYVRTYLE
ncbi:hypothetical protein BH10PSE11_BH10PSE11_04070 [soil metagenome]